MNDRVVSIRIEVPVKDEWPACGASWKIQENAEVLAMVRTAVAEAVAAALAVQPLTFSDFPEGHTLERDDT